MRERPDGQSCVGDERLTEKGGAEWESARSRKKGWAKRGNLGLKYVQRGAE